MKLEITFGWHLDGPTFPEQKAIGKLSVGPIGLLNQLALRLGLIRPFPPQAVRIAEYMSRLQEVDDGSRFFSASFKTDPWGTAKWLLHLRDELVGAGWKCDFEPSQQLSSEQSENQIGQSRSASTDAAGQSSDPYPATERLKLLAKIEMLRNNDLGCLSDLSSAIVERLDAGCKAGIDTLILLEDEPLLPPVWRLIISALKKNGVEVKPHSCSKTEPDNDIARVKNFLLSKANTVSQAEQSKSLAGDGSFVVLEADDEVQACDFLVGLLQSESNDKAVGTGSRKDGSTVIIRESSTSFVDQLLKRSSLPILGGSASSPLRGYMLVLPLAIELCWKPFDPARLIEFLLLPNCPVPPFIASCFLSALQSEPGVGGNAWIKAWKDALERMRKALSNKVSADNQNETPEKVAARLDKELLNLQFRWKLWLEPPLFDPKEGMPAAALMSICDRVQTHALALHNLELNSDVFIKTALFAETLSNAVKTGYANAGAHDLIPRSQLHRMLESVLSDGYKADEPEASKWIPVDHPGQVCGQSGKIIWWGFVKKRHAPKSSPWTREELEYLRHHGVVIEHPQAAVIREAKSWRRPLYMGSEQILLVKPRTVAGSPVAAHPFYHELSELIDSTPHHIRCAIVRQAQVIYQQPAIDIFDSKIVRAEAQIIALPKPRPVWKIKAGSIAARRESPSSLESLLACPLRWLLKASKLKIGNLLSIPEGERLAGNLTHAVFAAVFERVEQFKTSIESDDLQKLTADVFDDLCPRIAAPLLLPGNGLERQRLKQTICQAIANLSALLKSAGYSRAICEFELNECLEDIELRGKPDIHLLHPDNRDFVIDLKWTKRSISHRRRELSEGHAIQLAVYAKLCRLKTGNPTEAGYYMVAQQQLLSSAEAPFPSHSYIQGPTLSETFDRIMHNYKEHLSLLQAGTVYATGVQDIEGAADTASSELILDDERLLNPIRIPNITLALEPPCKVCDYGGLCGKKEFDA